MPHKLLHALFFSIFLLSACSSVITTEAPQVPAEEEPTSLPDTETPLPTLTATEAKTDTPVPTATNTATYTLTPTMLPTQFMGFESARVFKALAYDEETIFYFIVPNVVSPYYGTVDGYDMVCETVPEEVNLLVCRAEEDLFGTDIKAFEFFADEEKTFLLYEGEFSTTLDKRPPTPVPNGLIWPRADYTADDITWGQTPPGCTARGINLTCEIEYRRYSDNSCLVGMSCWDSCGYYYSVNTIDNKVGDWVPSGPCW